MAGISHAVVSLFASNELSGVAKGCASGHTSDPLVELAALFVIQGSDQGIHHGVIFAVRKRMIWLQFFLGNQLDSDQAACGQKISPIRRDGIMQDIP